MLKVKQRHREGAHAPSRNFYRKKYTISMAYFVVEAKKIICLHLYSYYNN